MAMELIETITLSSSANSITFSNIPQDGTSLYLTATLRSNNSGNYSGGGLYFNSQNATYNTRRIQAAGSYAAYTQSNASWIVFTMTASGNVANGFSVHDAYIVDYATAGVPKMVTSLQGDAITTQQTALRILAGQWETTDAITSLTVYDTNANTMTADSSVSLYKIS